MKLNRIINFALLSSAILFSNFAYSQSAKTQSAKPQLLKIGANTYMLVRVIDGIKQNDTFQQNVGIMRRYDAAIKNAKKMLEKATQADKKNIEAKLKQIEDEYDANNALMIKNYNFSGNRQYRFVFEEVFLSTPLSDNEIDNLRTNEGIEIEPSKIVEKNSAKIFRQNDIKESAKIEIFQKAVGAFMSKQMELNNLQKELAATSDIAAKDKIATKITMLEKYLSQTQEMLKKDYSMMPKRKYVLEVKKMKIYLLLEPEEVIRLGVTNK